MKKLVFGLIATVMFGFVNNAQTTVYKGESKDSFIEASNVDSEINTIITEIKVTNKETKVTLPSFYYKFTSESNSDVRKDFENDPKSVSGIFTIEVDGQIVYKRLLKNGVFEKAEIIQFVGTTELGKKYSCTIKGIASCGNDHFNDMNFVDYAF